MNKLIDPKRDFRCSELLSTTSEQGTVLHTRCQRKQKSEIEIIIPSFPIFFTYQGNTRSESSISVAVEYQWSRIYNLSKVVRDEAGEKVWEPGGEISAVLQWFFCRWRLTRHVPFPLFWFPPENAGSRRARSFVCENSPIYVIHLFSQACVKTYKYRRMLRKSNGERERERE